jgi:hypothetical protein
MSSSFSVLTSALAVVALAMAAAQLAVALRELRNGLEELRTPPEPRGRRSGRAPRALLSALYPEASPSRLSTLAAVPGGFWIGAAVLLMALSVALGLRPPAATRSLSATPDPELARLRSRVDSLASSLIVVRDSIRLAAVAGPAHAQPREGRMARRTLPASPGIVPAAPRQPALTLDSTASLRP